jgi:hypothetical protein
MQSPAEQMARLVAGIVDAGERRATAMAVLAEAMAAARAEFNGDNLDDVPEVWITLHGFDRLRRTYAALVDLEVKAAVVVVDVRGLLARAAAGTEARPLGVTPLRAQMMLSAMADLRADLLVELFLDERSAARARRSLTPETAARLRGALHALEREEAETARQRDRLVGLMHSEEVAS